MVGDIGQGVGGEQIVTGRIGQFAPKLEILYLFDDKFERRESGPGAESGVIHSFGTCFCARVCVCVCACVFTRLMHTSAAVVCGAIFALNTGLTI